MLNKRRPKYFQYVTAEEDLEITQLLQSVMGKNPKSIAFSIGCDYQDMMNRVSNQPRSPRKFELILKILEHVKNPEPFIRWFNIRFGYAPPIRMPEVELLDVSLHKHITMASKELGDVARELLEATKDDIIDLNELRALNKEIMDLIQVSYQLDLFIKHLCESGG